MLINRMYLAALWAVALMVPQVSQAVPIVQNPLSLENAVEVGFMHFPSGKEISYDSETGVMSYRLVYPVSPDWEFGNIGIGFPFLSPATQYNGFFSWTATLDPATGQLQDKGSAVLALELGSGLELVATGSVVDFGFRSSYCYVEIAPSDPDPVQRCILDLPLVGISIDYLDPRFSDYLGNYWTTGAWVQVYQPGFGLPESFYCSTRWENNVDCGRYSNDVVVAFKVSEPESLALLGLGLLALSLARRRKAA
jgi:hypothetical protein